MYKWKHLELKKPDGRPKEGALAALRLTPKKPSPYYREESYEIGRLDRDKYDPTSRKLWWYSGRGGSDDLARRGKKYNIDWCYVPEYDFPV